MVEHNKGSGTTISSTDSMMRWLIKLGKEEIPTPGIVSDRRRRKIKKAEKNNDKS